jgi:hypothetical protein
LGQVLLRVPASDGTEQTAVWSYGMAQPQDLGLDRAHRINDSGFLVVSAGASVVIPEDNLDSGGNPGSDGIPDTWFRDDDADGSNGRQPR